MVTRFSFDYTDTGKMLIIPELGLLIFSFFCGWILRKKPNYRRRIILIVSIIYMFAHIGLYFLPNTDSPEGYHFAYVILFLIIMSMQYSVYCSAIVPSPTYFVEKKYLGITWGIIVSSVALSSSVVPLIQMKIIDSD